VVTTAKVGVPGRVKKAVGQMKPQALVVFVDLVCYVVLQKPQIRVQAQLPVQAVKEIKLPMSVCNVVVPVLSRLVRKSEHAEIQEGEFAATI
jgi:hypothetical protein